MAEEIKQEEEKKPEPNFEKPLDRMTVKELREVAINFPGVTGVHAMKKDELLALVREYYGIEEEVPAKKPAPKIAKELPNPKVLKAKIAELRAQREKARAEKDGKRVDTLRRRMNRMKKLTRKSAAA